MNKQMKPTNENNQILGDAIAQKVQDELNKKKTFALNLVESCQGSHLSFLNFGGLK